MEQNAVMSCPVPPDFWQPFFLKSSPLLLDEAPFLQKTAENGKNSLDRQEQVVQACQNIRILRHSLSQSVFSMFSHRFSSVFGLLTTFQGSVEDIQGPFLYFPHQNLFTEAQFGRSLVQHHQKIPPQYSFCSCKWKILPPTSFATCSCISLLCNTWAAHGRRERGMGLGLRRGRSVRSFSKRWEIRQLHYCLQLHHFRWHLTDEDMFGDLLRDEPMGLNPCCDSIDDLLMVRELMQLVPGTSQCSAIVQPHTRGVLGQTEQWLDVWRCAVCSKKIHRGRGTH